MNTLTGFLFTLIFTTTISSSSSFSSPDHFVKSHSFSLRSNSDPRQYFEVTPPLPTNNLKPSCSHTILQHSFANTYNLPPFTVPYSLPSDCPSPPWSHVVLDFYASSSGEQYDRIAGLWLGGVELLRTSTAEPTPDGIFWNVRKDVTRYSSLFSKSNLNFSMKLENIVNNIYTGVYRINVTLHFYEPNAVRFPSINLASDRDRDSNTVYNSPADLIIPISDDGTKDFWFRIENESDLHSKKIRIPMNTHRITMEIYVSFHGNDEFWYSNPPDSYIRLNNLQTERGNGAYREIFATIDGKYIGSEIPFPVIFTGGINPLFWEPIVSIKAFDLPSYNLDLTPFLGILLDNNFHKFGIGVTNGISYWLADANLHLWLDHHTSSAVEAGLNSYPSSELIIKRDDKFELLDGSFKINAKRKSSFTGWVKSSTGNLSTTVMREFSVINTITFKQNGTYKLVKQRIKSKKEVKMNDQTGFLVDYVVSRRKYPLDLISATLSEPEKSMYVLVTNVSHSFSEKVFNSKGELRGSICNSQDSGGWMEVEDHSVLSGEANTEQRLRSRDELGCYSRVVKASNGQLSQDFERFGCGSDL